MKQSLLLAAIMVRLIGFSLMAYSIPEQVSLWYTIHEFATYVLLIALVYFEKDTLQTYGIDRLGLFVLLMLRPVILTLQAIRYTSDLPSRVGLLVLALLAIWVARTVRISDLFSSPSGKALGFALLIGAVMGAGNGVLIAVYQGVHIVVDRMDIFVVFQLFIIQLATASALDEFLFRGFLMGWLRQRQLRPAAIFTAVTLLYWMGHVHYLGGWPISFWIVTPIASAVLTGLAMKTRSATTSLLAHGVFNVVTQVVAWGWVVYWT